MQVTCEYCGSYVEADENMTCPLCNAPLGSSVEAASEAAKQQEEAAAQAQHEREAAEKAQEAKETHISEVIQGVTNVATAFAAGSAISNVVEASNDDDDRPLPPPDSDFKGGMPPDDARNAGDHRHPDNLNRPNTNQAGFRRNDGRSSGGAGRPGQGGRPDGMGGGPGRGGRPGGMGGGPGGRR